MNTTKIMALVIIALMPSLIASIAIFGARALILAAVCVIASVVFEWAFEKLLKKPSTINDLSAVLTGLLIAMNVPVTLPYWIAVIGCFVAIVIVKQLFGGLGQNFANPAITARIVLFVSFASDMTIWADPTQNKVLSAADAVTSATPLGILNESGVAEAQSQFSNMTMFLGNTGGSMGEVCAAALLIGGLFLIIMKIISPATPIAFLGTIAVFSLIVGADPVWQICAGGAMLGAFFMATDYATTPTTTMGKVIFGIGCGLITMLIRFYGNYPEGVSFSILIMNILTPHINSFCEKRLYGNPKKAAKQAAEGGAK
jgi:electron transport complex protein RnfD